MRNKPYLPFCRLSGLNEQRNCLRLHMLAIGPIKGKYVNFAHKKVKKATEHNAAACRKSNAVTTASETMV
ncbi:hypothetical protein Ngar_c20700 [Candidatus Nitrososphaera gargensis Ga9.2]|uniref:Uncharacterized protein n=1 Tax=Nitrososphaera gargensis (strain Ga9.2) TaxID=1237085 RepID=K0ICA5_NITGG|nr:hypothetical protein Ngar_c20700 [Candidatus Nitrososphaera gargensis Ga9.2]